MPTNNLITARSYAKAIFAIAQQQNKLAMWKDLLNLFAQTYNTCFKHKVFLKPDLPQNQLLDIFDLNKGSMLTLEVQNFLRLLIRKKHLQILPEVNKLFLQLYNQHENILEVEVIVPFPLTPAKEQKFIDVLTKKYQKKIVLNCKLDSTLIGGALIKVGDEVTDYTVQSRIRRCLAV